MHVSRLTADLGRPGVWPEAGPVEVRHTHISVVFLVGDRAYKVKKPVELGFLDFSTLQARREACEDEVRLNRRFSPDVYLRVMPIGERDGVLVPDAEPAVEWAVVMRRLPDEATLLAAVEAGTADGETVAAVGHRIAAFHAVADAGPAIEACARLDVVAHNARENFDQTRDHVGHTVDVAVWTRLRDRVEGELERLGPTLDARAAGARDTHGDLRLEHVYLLPGQPPRFLDCIEFNERFRFADPISDLAFLAMDLGVRGERELARVLVDAWVEESGDTGARVLLPFYLSYRSTVRAKVAGYQFFDPEASPEREARALFRARRHWLYALDVLETPDRRPCLVGVGGLPGTGKSTVARGLIGAGFEVIRADVVRKERAGLAPETSAAAGFGQGMYTTGERDAVYAACLDQAQAVVERGGRAIVDASFSREAWRVDLLERARTLGVEARLIWCEAPRDVVRERLAARVGDASDADWDVYLGAVARWEPPGEAVEAASIHLGTAGVREVVVARAVRALQRAGLAAGEQQGLAAAR